MSLVMLKDLPRYESLLQAAQDFPDLDPSAAEAFLHLIRTSDVAFRVVENNLSRHHLTQGRFGVLMALLANHRMGNQGAPLTPTALAERTAVTPATMTGLIDTLEKDGLVQRLSDPQDRRKVIVSLAPRAHDLLAQILPGHFRLIAAMLRPLSRSDRKHLVSLLRVVAAHATRVAADRETTGAEASPA